MHALIWIVTGLAAGWLSALLMRGRHYGLTADLLLGTIGGLVGGWVLRLAGFSAPEDWLKQAIVSLFGAMLLLGAAMLLRPGAQQPREGDAGSTRPADLTAHLHWLSEFEKRAIERLRGRTVRAQNPNEMFEKQLTVGQRVADQVARFGGSWTFIGVFLLFMLLWMAWNTESVRRFDPYPFILLNLMLSCVAAMQAPVIMMSQNRQAAKDRLDARNDYDVNVRAETEIARLHAKFDELREREWAELVEMQRRQIVLLEDTLRRLGGSQGSPPMPPGE